jgi:hypothetical protein
VGSHVIMKLKDYFLEIIAALNLIGESKFEKDILHSLRYFKHKSKDTDYRFSADDLLRYLISDVFDNKEGADYENARKMLKHLISEKFLDEDRKVYRLNTKSLKMISEYENFNRLLKRILSTIGSIGGFIYLILQLIQGIKKIVIS